MDEQIAYWERQLSGLIALELPTDRPRPAVRTAAGEVHRFTVPEPLTARLVELGRSRGIPLFTTLVAATQVLLARYTGQQDLAIGTVTSGRSPRRGEEPRPARPPRAQRRVPSPSPAPLRGAS